MDPEIENFVRFWLRSRYNLAEVDEHMMQAYSKLAVWIWSQTNNGGHPADWNHTYQKSAVLLRPSLKLPIQDSLTTWIIGQFIIFESPQ